MSCDPIQTDNDILEPQAKSTLIPILTMMIAFLLLHCHHMFLSPSLPHCHIVQGWLSGNIWDILYAILN